MVTLYLKLLLITELKYCLGFRSFKNYNIVFEKYVYLLIFILAWMLVNSIVPKFNVSELANY